MAIVNLYKVNWVGTSHKYPTQNTDFVVAAANSGAVALAALVKTNNGDNKTVTVTDLEVVRTGIIQ